MEAELFACPGGIDIAARWAGENGFDARDVGRGRKGGHQDVLTDFELTDYTGPWICGLS
jgi:hypothetical protein